ADVRTASLRRPHRSSDAPLAISDDGAYVLMASGGAVRLIGTAGENLKLMDAVAGVWGAFAPRSHDAAVLDSEAGLVPLLDAGGSQPRMVFVPARQADF